jgi:hypothetical protein
MCIVIPLLLSVSGNAKVLVSTILGFLRLCQGPRVK